MCTALELYHVINLYIIVKSRLFLFFLFLNINALFIPF